MAPASPAPEGEPASPAPEGAAWDEHRRANLANWESRVDIHVRSASYGAEAFVADPAANVSGVVAFDAPRVGDVRGKRLLHLQCHFGRDTLSWAVLGAQVTGVDFSPSAIAAARELSERSGVPGRFVEAELHDAPGVLDEVFDVVYTSVGALNWLPSAAAWAKVAAGFVAPGGILYMREAHPALQALDDERPDELLVLTYPYFETAEPQRWETPTSYTGDADVVSQPVTYEWNHGLGDVLGGVLATGLVIEAFEEHRFLDWRFFPWMVEGDDGRYRLPHGQERVPLQYSLRARRPRQE